MEPHSVDALWALFWARDQALIVLFLAPLTALGVYAAHQWHQHERFMAEHPETATLFRLWLKKPKAPDKRECPTHHMLVLWGSCPMPGCDWKPPQ